MSVPGVKPSFQGFGHRHAGFSATISRVERELVYPQPRFDVLLRERRKLASGINAFNGRARLLPSGHGNGSLGTSPSQVNNRMGKVDASMFTEVALPRRRRRNQIVALAKNAANSYQHSNTVSHTLRPLKPTVLRSFFYFL